MVGLVASTIISQVLFIEDGNFTHLFRPSLAMGGIFPASALLPTDNRMLWHRLVKNKGAKPKDWGAKGGNN